MNWINYGSRRKKMSNNQIKHKIIAFANQKGGVGKTTSAVNIAACIAKSGYSVLMIDCDPQEIGRAHV